MTRLGKTYRSAARIAEALVTGPVLAVVRTTTQAVAMRAMVMLLLEDAGLPEGLLDRLTIKTMEAGQ